MAGVWLPPDLQLVQRLRATHMESKRLLARARGRARHAVVLSLTADAEAPAVARNAVAELAARAGAPTEIVDGIRTAISEAVTNAVVHGYADRAPGRISVDAYVFAGVLTVLVADDGHGPREASPNPGLGLGWKLIAQFADKYTVTRRSTGGTLLDMRFRLSDRRFIRGSVPRI